MDKNTIQELKLTFDDIIHSTKDGVEYWNARELCKILGYNEFNKFVPVIKKAMIACENSGFSVSDHFAEVQIMVKTILNLKEIPKPDDTADALAAAICHGHSADTRKMLREIKLK